MPETPLPWQVSTQQEGGGASPRCGKALILCKFFRAGPGATIPPCSHSYPSSQVAPIFLATPEPVQIACYLICGTAPLPAHPGHTLLHQPRPLGLISISASLLCPRPDQPLFCTQVSPGHLRVGLNFSNTQDSKSHAARDFVLLTVSSAPRTGWMRSCHARTVASLI